MNKINKIKIVTVVGTRPEIIRLSSVINRLNKSKSIDHFLIHTGQNYDHNLNDVFFKDLDILKPNYYLDAAKETPTKTIGEILIKIDPILDKIDPDAILVLGDTNSCLSVISAKKKKIPIFHLEAGNRCFDMRVPEETNRRIVDHISDINLTYSSIAREHLINEGIKSDRIINVGSPMFEVLQKHKVKIKRSKIIDKLKIKKNKYILVSCHREENIDNDKNFESLTETLNCLADNYKLDIIFSAHPRTRKKFELKKPKLNKLVRLIEPLGFIDYNNLQINSYVVLSDSGTISEESSILNIPAITIRQAHERPEGMDETTVLMSGLKKERLLESVHIATSHNNSEARSNRPKDHYLTTYHS